MEIAATRPRICLKHPYPCSGSGKSPLPQLMSLSACCGTQTSNTGSAPCLALGPVSHCPFCPHCSHCPLPYPRCPAVPAALCPHCPRCPHCLHCQHCPLASEAFALKMWHWVHAHHILCLSLWQLLKQFCFYTTSHK